MPTFSVSVYREWTEYGTVQISADDEDTAKEAAEEMLTSGDGEIIWHGENMEPGQQAVDSCEQVYA